MPPITFGRYPNCPHTIVPDKVPNACKKLWVKLRACEDKAYPYQTNCFPQRAIFRMCLRVTTFGSSQ